MRYPEGGEGQQGGRGSTNEEIQSELLNQLKPSAMLFDSIYTLQVPALPPNMSSAIAATISITIPMRGDPDDFRPYSIWY